MSIPKASIKLIGKCINELARKQKNYIDPFKMADMSNTRKSGALKGAIRVANDVDAPLPDDIQSALESVADGASISIKELKGALSKPKEPVSVDKMNEAIAQSAQPNDQ